MLRFAAAFAVVWVHANDFAQRLGLDPGVLSRGALENLGAIGVDVFFVISGFIITRTVQRRPGLSAMSFLQARWLRVVPLYFIFSAPWVAAAVVGGTAHPDRWVATILFWPSFGETLTQPFLPIGWSLCFEMLFYVAVALGLAIGKAGRWAMVAAYAGCAVLAFTVGGPLFGYLGSPLVIEFLAGAAIALGSRYFGPRAPMFGALALVAAVLWLALFVLAGDPGVAGADLASRYSVLRLGLWGPPAVLLVWAMVLLEPKLPDIRATRAIVHLGRASYAIYLSHLLVLVLLSMALEGRLIPGGADGWVLLALAASTAAGVTVLRFVEDPLRRSLNSLTPFQGLRPAAALG
jgi:exopolysaccharide production protein ExoZ